jgi:hypothetical protein
MRDTNGSALLTELEGAPTLWAAADIVEQLAKNSTSAVYPIMDRLLRRFALNTWSKPPYKAPRLHSNQQIFEASLMEQWDGITEEGLFEAITSCLSENIAASCAATRLAELNPAYAVLPRIVTPWVTRRDAAA